MYSHSQVIGGVSNGWKGFRSAPTLPHPLERESRLYPLTYGGGGVESSLDELYSTESRVVSGSEGDTEDSIDPASSSIPPPPSTNESRGLRFGRESPQTKTFLMDDKGEIIELKKGEPKKGHWRFGCVQTKFSG